MCHIHAYHNPQDTVTHQSSKPKTSVTISWSPPSLYIGKVYVAATVVKNFATYWVDIKSDMVMVRGIEEQVSGREYFLF